MKQVKEQNFKAKFCILTFGVISGLLCYSYSSGNPGFDKLPADQFHRSLRIFAPIGLALFSTYRLPREWLQSITGQLMILVFITIPVSCLLVLPLESYLYSVVGTVTLSGLVLFLILALQRELFLSYLLGVAIGGGLLFLDGFWQYGFLTVTYYSRPRALFGFVHPIASASAITCSVAIIGILGLTRKLPVHPVLLAVLSALVFGPAYYFAGSRNFIIAILVGISIYVAFKIICRGYQKLGKVLIVAIASMPWFIYVISAVIEAKQSAPPFGIHRLADFSWFLDVNYLNVEKVLWGPHLFLQLAYEGEAQAFAAADSVFLAYMAQFGILMMVPLFGFFLGLGWRLANQKDYIGIALWAALISLYTFDAQGITTSNLIVFLLFGLVVYRAAHGPLDQKVGAMDIVAKEIKGATQVQVATMIPSQATPG